MPDIIVCLACLDGLLGKNKRNRLWTFFELATSLDAVERNTIVIWKTAKDVRVLSIIYIIGTYGLLLLYSLASGFHFKIVIELAGFLRFLIRSVCINAMFGQSFRFHSPTSRSTD